MDLDKYLSTCGGGKNANHAKLNLQSSWFLILTFLYVNEFLRFVARNDPISE